MSISWVSAGKSRKLSQHLKITAAQLQPDALDIYLIRPRANQPICFYRFGFNHNLSSWDQIQTWQGLVWRVIQKRDLVSLPELWTESTSLQRVQLFRQEGFRSYHAVPITRDGTVIGVLETYFRRRFQPDQAWFNMLRDQASAIAELLISN